MERLTGPVPGRITSNLAARGLALYLQAMTRAHALCPIDRADRARLRERFFGASRSVLARL
jgi:hypothetical protein